MKLRLCALAAAAASFAADAWAVDPPHELIACTDCHFTHGAAYPTLLGRLCESCHFDGGPATAVETHSSRTTDASYGDWDLDCWSCHDPHAQQQDRTWGTTYGKLVRTVLSAQIKLIDPAASGPYYPPLAILRAVTSSSLRFTSANEFVDGDAAASDDVCQVCHQNTAYYNVGAQRNVHADYGAESQPGGTCTSCHGHDAGFAAGGGSCLGCHATAQPGGPSPYRRQVVGVGGDFGRASHHVTDGTASEVVAAEDCAVCHDQSAHQANGDPTVELFDPDLGAALSYTFDGTGASIEPFCLGCHDADGPLAHDGDGNPGNGRQPFSDGRDPADVDSVWSGSAHATSAAGALATDRCLACHGGADATRAGEPAERNAHGSSRASLLSTVVAGETTPDAEEGLCFACHDGAPATTDVEAMFAASGTMTAASAAKLNSHHDVKPSDQTYSGARIECRDCHDPHAASGANPLIADPDPADGIVPLAGRRFATSTWLTEWCLDCHDGSFPLGVQGPTMPLVNIVTDWTSCQHGGGLASKTVALRAGSGYARGDILQCTDCHNPGHGATVSGGVYPNVANLRAVVMSKDGGSELPPDFVWQPGTNIVRLLDVNSADATRNGRAFCSTCHPNPMGGNKTTGCLAGNCHNHAVSSF